MGAVVLAGLLLTLVYRWMHKNVLTDPRLYSPDEVAKKKAKLQLGVWESTKMLYKSPYLLKIAVLMLGYGVAINLIECIWKGQIKLQYPNSNDFNALMGKLSLTTGALTITVMLVGANLLRLFSWRTVALITPIFLLLTGFVFFGVIMYENVHGLEANILGVTVLFLAVVVGLVQDAFTKGVKYSLFDSTMQMAYIPLDPELKVKGQAAVSVLGGRGGKAGGAAIQSSLILAVGGNVSLASMVGVLSTIVFIVVIVWIFAVIGLGKQFEDLTKEREEAHQANT
jgi:AAA family ATP:ADP antiporter